MTPELLSFDAVAIISVDRKSAGEPYLYKTLRSLFQELPQNVPINVFVGDSDLDYVTRRALQTQFGEFYAARIHVFSTPPDVDFFLKKHFTRMGWATWNYGRALRSYHGVSRLLLLKDDVIFSRHFLPVFER